MEMRSFTLSMNLSVEKRTRRSILIKNTNKPITTRDESEIKGLRMMFLSAYLRMNMGKRRELRVKSIEKGFFVIPRHAESVYSAISLFR
jgi:hypothetical protein